MATIAYIASLTAEQEETRTREAQLRAVWSIVNDQAAWDARTAAQRSEDTRRVLRGLIKQAYGDRLT